MAAKEKNDTVKTANDDINSKKQPKKSKGGSKLIPILILIAVIGAVAGILFFNLFDIRDRYLRTALEKVPIVNHLLPPEASPSPEDQYASMTREQLIAQINTLNAQIAQNERELAAAKSLSGTDAETIDSLKKIADQQDQFTKNQKKFDEMIAMQDPQAYAAFYASVNPANADELYRQAVGVVARSADMKKYIGNFAAMDPTSAAKAFEQMITADMDLVVEIIKSMDSDHVGEIFNAMDPKNVASIGKMMYPTPAPVVTDTPASEPEASPAPSPTAAPAPVVTQ